uniref:Uncharacterized protein n=1 Tax=Ditylenchus dipsaci TaxID=166011 RepID=A0A915DLH0_9BILA
MGAQFKVFRFSLLGLYFICMVSMADSLGPTGSKLVLFADEYGDLPEELNEVISIDSTTKDLIVTLRFNQMDSLVFNVSSPPTECLELENKAVFAYNEARECDVMFWWSRSRAVPSLNFHSSSSEARQVVFSKKVKDVSALINITNTPDGSQSIVSGKANVNKSTSEPVEIIDPCHFHWFSANSFGYDGEEFAYCANLHLANAVERWTEKNFVPSCVLQLKFSGDSFRVLHKNVYKSVNSSSSLPSHTTTKATHVDNEIDVSSAPLNHSQKRDPSSMETNSSSWQFVGYEWSPIILGIDLLAGSLAVIVMLVLTITVLCQYFSSDDDEQLTSEAINAQKVLLTRSRSDEALKNVTVTQPIQAAAKEEKKV